MNTTLGPIFWAQLKNLTKSIIKKFKSDLLNSLKRDHTNSRQDFGEVVKEHKDKATKEFESAAQCESNEKFHGPSLESGLGTDHEYDKLL